MKGNITLLAALISVTCYTQGESSTLKDSPPLPIIQQTIDTEILLSKEKREWETRKATLNDLITLYENELILIEEELEASGEVSENLDTQSEKLKQQTKTLQKQRAVLQKKTQQQAKRLLEYIPQFPLLLQEMIAPEEAVLVNQNSRVRDLISAIITILKAANTFNNSIHYSTLTEEVDGQKRQMQVLSIGLGLAYYVSGDTAGIGKPSTNGWQWKEIPDSTSSIEKAIAVFQKTRRPELIQLPVQR